MACMFLGIIPHSEDMAYDGGYDAICPPAGGAAIQKKPISENAFERLAGVKTHQARDLYRKTQQVVMKCLELMAAGRQIIATKGNYKHASYVSRSFVESYFTKKGQALSVKRLTAVMQSIDAQLERLWSCR